MIIWLFKIPVKNLVYEGCFKIFWSKGAAGMNPKVLNFNLEIAYEIQFKNKQNKVILLCCGDH